jgi:DNA-binding NarL/FixJ family response regulator
MRARVLLADDHSRVREILTRILSTEFEVAGAFEDGASLLRAVAELSPDAVVVDVSMPGMDGFSVLRELRNNGSDVKVILISAFDEPSFGKIAVEWGASGFVSKCAAYEELIPAVRAALDDRIYRSSLIKDKPA